MSKIQEVRAREIIAGRGVVSLEVTVETDDGAQGVSTPESGVSTGSHEAAFLLDGGERYSGKGVRKAAEAVNAIIGPALIGMDIADQAAIDEAMIELDGTPIKARLGANAIVGVSLAAIQAAAASSGQPLYRMVGGVSARTLPIPIYGIGTGGRYRDPGTSRWFKPSYEFCAYGANGYATALEWSWRCAQETRRLLAERYPDRYNPSYRSNGLAGVIDHDRELLEIMTESIVNCGYEGQVGIYFDCAADCYYEADVDRYVGLFGPGEKTRDEVIQELLGFVGAYPIVSLEDPLREDDFEGHALATQALGIEIVGDDLFTTNIERLRQGIEAGAANSMVLKITQVGTVTEALAACRLALTHGYNVHPCGSRGDNRSIGDFAVGLNTGQVRATGHNRLLAIEEELGSAALWQGRRAYKGWRNRKEGK
jgi:enolase